MKPPLSLAAFAVLCLVLPGGASPDRGVLVSGPASCKPDAPIDIEVLDASVADGLAFVRYRVASRIDGLRLDTALELPDGGRILNDRRVRARGVTRHDPRIGSARVRLPAGPAGGRVTIRAALTFVASGGELDGLEETVVATRTLGWGALDPTPDLPLVESDGVVSLDVPALRTGGDNR
ncbi:MAG: hypothetical protein ACF8XB_18815 [Planctomycetota bacterium JB042]